MSTKIKDVYVISETTNEDEKSRWSKIGVGFLNKDGSINLIFDALPLKGRVHVRDRKPKS